MKKFLGAGLLALFASAAVFAASGNVTVVYDGERHRVSSFEYDGMTVCGLKSYVAANLGLDATEFNLTKGGPTLKGDALLKDVAVYPSSTLYAKETTRSWQC